MTYENGEKRTVTQIISAQDQSSKAACEIDFYLLKITLTDQYPPSGNIGKIFARKFVEALSKGINGPQD